MRIEQRRISHQHVLWQGMEGSLKKRPQCIIKMLQMLSEVETEDMDILHTSKTGGRKQRHNNNKQ